MTQTPSPTGFPLQAAFDNTNGLANALYGSVQTISSTSYAAVSFYLPEADPACGPGKYALADVSLGLSLVATQPTIFSLSLHVADPVSWLPSTPLASVLASAPAVGATPAYRTLPLPSTWTLDAVASRSYVIVVSSDVAVGWNFPVDQPADRESQRGV